MGNPETLEVLKEKLNDIVKFITKHNTITIKDVESILMIKDEKEKQLVFDQDIIVKGVQGKSLKLKPLTSKTRKGNRNKRYGIRHRSCGYRKNLYQCSFGSKSFKGETSKTDYPHTPCGGSGESLGFLPGDLKEKLDPYLQPLYDALRDMIPHEKLEGFIEKSDRSSSISFYERANFGRCFCNFRRSTKYNSCPNENVSNKNGDEC